VAAPDGTEGALVDGEFVLSWTSGFPDRRPVYLYERPDRWGATENREEATRYPSRQAAIAAWMEKHAWPEDYEKYLESGSVRAEAAQQLEMPW
jgi:hypothetical protein